MKAQTPAEGVLQRNDWGDSRLYQVTCSCHENYHDHHVWVEANEDGEIVVTIHTNTTTTFWSTNRWQQMWQLLTRGHIRSEVGLSMSQQQALNYAATLETAVHEIAALQDQTAAESVAG